MKKAIRILCLFVIIFFITGCEDFEESEKEDRIGMTKEMKRLNIISKDSKQIDIENHCHSSLESCSCSNTYIFEDSNSNIVGIQYAKVEDSNKDHQVYIYYDISRANDYKYITEEERDCTSINGDYTYKDNKITDKTKYNKSNKNQKVYNVKKRVVIPFIKYKYIFSEP